MSQTVKLFLILLMAVVVIAVGNILLSLAQRPPAADAAIPAWLRGVVKLDYWPLLIAGGLCHATFFLLYIWALRLADVSFVQPFTAVNIALTALGGFFLLRENVNGTRWLGIAMVFTGAILIGLTTKDENKPPPISSPPSAANR